MKDTIKKGALAALLVVVLLALGAWAFARHQVKDNLTLPSALAAAVPSQEAIHITPHRAIYRMSLASVKNGSPIVNVSGKMLYDWEDTCDGWAIQQHLSLRFQYAEGDDTEVNSSVLSWESKDEKKYRFQVRRISDGKESENFKGIATLGAKGGLATYSLPKDKANVKLPEETIFPTAHTRMILNRALAGDKMFTRRVFDGSDEEGAADVSAFIGARKVDEGTPDLAPSVRDNPLLKEPYWPVRLSFYKPDTTSGASGLPDYEMDLMLQNNGVARFMRIDYGDFVVQGILVGLEPAPTFSCTKS